MRQRLLVVAKWLQKHFYATSVLSGFLLGCGFLAPWATPFGILGLIILFWLLPKLQTWPQVVGASTLFWGVKTLLAMSFLWNIYPIYWITDIAGSVQLSMIGVVWLLTGVTAGIGGAVFGLVFFLITKTWQSRWLVVPMIALAWLMSEVIFSLFHALSALGQSVPVQLSFTFGYVGYIAAAIPGLYFVGAVGGVYLLSFVLLVVVQMILYVVRKASLALLVLPVVKFTIITFVIFYFIQYESQAIQIAVIDTNFRINDTSAPLSHWDEQFSALHSAIKLAVPSEPDFILLPEDARYYKNLAQRSGEPEIQFDRFQMSSFDGVIIDTARVEIVERAAVARATYWQSNTILATQDKFYLTPYGEYRSYWLEALLQQLQLSEVIGSEFGDYYASDLYQRTETVDSKTIPITFFCSESMSPTVIKDRLQSTPEAPFVYHPVSHAWFNRSQIMVYQLDMMLRTHALWSRLPIVVAANEGVGKVYYPDGQIVVPDVTEAGKGWQLKIFEI